MRIEYLHRIFDFVGPSGADSVAESLSPLMILFSSVSASVSALATGSLPTELLTANLAYVCIFFAAFWLLSVILRDVSIVDSLWGLGFVLIAWGTYCSVAKPDLHDRLLVALVTVWGVRLATYLTWRNWGKPEDYRYASMRRAHGGAFPIRSLVTIFLLQAVLCWVIAMPLQFGFGHATAGDGLLSLGIFDTLGLAFWSIGFFFEAVGDFQLARFKSDSANRGRVMSTGLWRYTRHPNYFGDFMVWWGLYFFALTPANWFFIVIGPVLMSFFLMKVTGVTLLEKGVAKRLDGYADYVRRTSAFFPMPPQRD